jgi:predicted permease
MDAVGIPAAFRAIGREPWSSAAIVLTLTLGIAATTTVYAVFNHLVFRPTPGVRAPDELVSVAFQPEGGSRTWASGPFEAMPLFSSADTGLRSVGVWHGGRPSPVAVRLGEDPRLLGVEFVAPQYLETLGVRARLGRLLTSEETSQAGHAVSLISEALWHREFGGTTDVLGRTIGVNGTPFSIVGVVDDYRGWGRSADNTVDVWLPQTKPAEPVALFVGRVQPGRSVTDVESRLREVYAPLRATLDARRSEMVPWVYAGLRRGPIAPISLDVSFSFVLAIAGLLTLLACANAGNLLLARTARRRQDLVLRAAIGASRARLIRLLLAEAVTLAGLAVGTGLVVTAVVARMLEGVQLFETTGALSEVSLDWRVVLFASASGAITVMGFALAPIVSATRVDLRPVLQQASRFATGTQRLRRALVALQVALSLVLMATAGVLVQSLWNLRAIDLGMSPERVFSFTFHPGLINLRGSEAAALLTRVVERLQNTAGVDAVGTANPSPFLQSRNQGRVSPGIGLPQAPVRVERTTVSSDYFKALGIPLLAGRTFDESETSAPAAAPGRSVILNNSLARMLFGEQPAVGRQMAVGGREVTVVGVADDTKTTFTLRQPDPAMVVYEPTDGLFVFSRIFVRASLALSVVQPRVYQVVHEVEPRLPLVDAGTLTDEVERLIPEDRALTQLLATVAIVATLLGFSGVYAMTAYSVSERTREFGVRLALGASPWAVIRNASSGVTTTAVVGSLFGFAGYWIVARLVASRLFRVAPLDPTAVGGAAILLAILVFAGAALAARRATKVDPVTALRAD